MNIKLAPQMSEQHDREIITYREVLLNHIKEARRESRENGKADSIPLYKDGSINYRKFFDSLEKNEKNAILREVTLELAKPQTEKLQISIINDPVSLEQMTKLILGVKSDSEKSVTSTEIKSFLEEVKNNQNSALGEGSYIDYVTNLITQVQKDEASTTPEEIKSFLEEAQKNYEILGNQSYGDYLKSLLKEEKVSPEVENFIQETQKNYEILGNQSYGDYLKSLLKEEKVSPEVKNFIQETQKNYEILNDQSYASYLKSVYIKNSVLEKQENIHTLLITDGDPYPNTKNVHMTDNQYNQLEDIMFENGINRRLLGKIKKSVVLDTSSSIGNKLK